MSTGSQLRRSERLSIVERLDIARKILFIIVKAPYHLVHGLFRGPHGAKRYWTHVSHALMRATTSTLSARQNQLLGLTTEEAYEAFAVRSGIPIDTVELNHGGLGHWMGSKDATKVLVYYHGGGFQLSAHSVYFTFLWGLIQHTRAHGQDLAVFVPTYTLTPHGVYPTQLRQAVESLRYILAETHFRPSDVFLGGDSAGGNLLLGVLSHLSYPHPEIDVLDIISDLAGVMAISPWVSFSTEWPSIELNRCKDLVTRDLGLRWMRAYLAGQPSDNYSEPFLAPASWWREVKVQDVLVVAGSEELLLSSIEAFAGALKQVKPRTTLAVAEGEAHVSAIWDLGLGLIAESQQRITIQCWLRDRIITASDQTLGS